MILLNLYIHISFKVTVKIIIALSMFLTYIEIGEYLYKIVLHEA